MPQPEHQLTVIATLYIFALVHDIAPADDIDHSENSEDTHEQLSAVLTQENARALDATNILQLATAAKRALRQPANKTLSAAAYDKERAKLVAGMPRSGDAGVKLWPPTSQTVRAHLGNGAWNDALHAVGIPTAKTGRARGTSHFSSEDFRKALTDFSETSESVSYSAYQKWVKAEREQGRERPAGATVRNTFGLWSEAMRHVST